MRATRLILSLLSLISLISTEAKMTTRMIFIKRAPSPRGRRSRLYRRCRPASMMTPRVGLDQMTTNSSPPEQRKVDEKFWRFCKSSQRKEGKKSFEQPSRVCKQLFARIHQLCQLRSECNNTVIFL